ncbi:uncharacterized protein LOC101859089 [Aplysia californica]|uniref:Uncharacterized protein LOC101859089 n=1 Tax=Aplysia californica TaxID=6500 RepID=A0ABM0JJD2_APLCA|nr:uncharacterized protein LOC101859089 [Aplysia californica]XP_035824750.1 uncharacterized protein LOC101859089 [Aplysia californica]
MGGSLSCVKNKNNKKETTPAAQAPNRTNNYKTIDDDTVGNQAAEIQKATGKENKNRMHPYDEITDEQLAEGRAAASANGYPGTSGVRSHDAAPPSAMTLQNDRHGASAASGGDSTDDVSDLYAKVNKVKLNEPEKGPGSPTQLNYIEVEFNTEASKPPTRRSHLHSPTTYTNVINDNGKVVLLTDS